MVVPFSMTLFADARFLQKIMRDKPTNNSHLVEKRYRILKIGSFFFFLKYSKDNSYTLEARCLLTRSKRKTFNTQGRVTTICNKIVEIRSSSGVTSEHKKIHTPFSPLQLGCFLFPTGSLNSSTATQ